MRIEHTGQRLDTFEFLRLHQASVSNASSISYDSASRELLLEVVYPETTAVVEESSQGNLKYIECGNCVHTFEV